MENSRSRHERLVELRDKLEESIEECESMRDLAALSRQYRETLKEIEEIEGSVTSDDAVAAILAERHDTGKAGAVR